MNKIIVTAILAIPFSAAGAQAQLAATSQPTQMQPQPCSTATSNKTLLEASPIKPSAKTDQKLDSAAQSATAKTGIDFTGVLHKLRTIKQTTPPCDTPVPNKPVASVPKAPPGVTATTVWACNPVIIASDAAHTTTFFTPDQITVAVPALANTYEADTARADLSAQKSCASLRRDPTTNKVYSTQ